MLTYLSTGQGPRWLFTRMVRLSQEIVVLMADEFGTSEVLRRLSDPHWFQALGCLLGFDWHSSGLTTTTCGALKEALRTVGPEIGLFAAAEKARSPAALLRRSSFGQKKKDWNRLRWYTPLG
jgi:hypothetical protein